jgi:membrane protease YdiL (CAAX protease family)
MSVDVSFVPSESRPSSFGGIRAAGEIAFVMGSSFVAAMLIQAAIKPSLAQSISDGAGPPDLLAASSAMLQQFAAQYGTLLALVLLIGWWRGRRAARAYALTSAKLSPRKMVRYGVALGLLAGLPATVLLLIQEYSPIGAEPPLWTALRAAPKDVSFWIFMAVGSFAVVPVVEELAWRGYVLGRFTEAIAPGAAVVATAVPFALAHTQYSSFDPAMIFATLALLLLSFAITLATIRTGSVWPAVIGHAIINFPIHGLLGPAKLIAALLMLMFFWKEIVSELRSWARILFYKDTFQAIPALLTVAGFLAVLLWSMSVNRPVIAIGLAVVALATIAFSRSAWRSGPTV